MSVENHTPFPALAFRQYNMVGDMMGVVVARGTFKLTRGGPLRLVDEQYPLVMSDTYDGDSHQTPQVCVFRRNGTVVSLNRGQQFH